MSECVPEADDQADTKVDREIETCIDLSNPRSFFLFAGAGSGKTRSLVSILNYIREKNGKLLQMRGQQVAVITYTNAACDEIKSRLSFDPLAWVSTIHSFVWELIHGFTLDIRNWLNTSIAAEILELKEKERNGRKGKASTERLRSIEAKSKRLALLPSIRLFVYSPTGDNRGRDALSHAEVIKMGAYFLEAKPLMQELLLSRFPILFIDESQDTNGLLMNAFLSVQSKHPKRIALGLFGDLMQRIYMDGKSDLGRQLPTEWATPAKVMNHRCPKRIVTLINKIRSTVDNHLQRARSDAVDGVIRFFIAPNNVMDKMAIEAAVKRRMSVVTSDMKWESTPDVKILILEHQMAAKRLNFGAMFGPLYGVDDFKTSVRDGSFPPLAFFSHAVLPLVLSSSDKDSVATTNILRKYSPLLSKETLSKAAHGELKLLEKARDAVNSLLALEPMNGKTTFRSVMKNLLVSGLIELPESLYPFADPTPVTDKHIQLDEERSVKENALSSFLDTPFSQIVPYTEYTAGLAAFDTHQGVKGREFPRVMVVMDDSEAGGFLFSYEKLFGAKAPSSADKSNLAEGKESGVDRTRRLFYVTCSRSQSSLALIAYSENQEQVRKTVIEEGWFDEAEIEMLK